MKTQKTTKKHAMTTNEIDVEVIEAREAIEKWPHLGRAEAKADGFRPFTSGFLVSEMPLMLRMLRDLKSKNLKAIVVIGGKKQPEIWTKHLCGARSEDGKKRQFSC